MVINAKYKGWRAASALASEVPNSVDKALNTTSITISLSDDVSMIHLPIIKIKIIRELRKVHVKLSQITKLSVFDCVKTHS